MVKLCWMRVKVSRCPVYDFTKSNFSITNPHSSVHELIRVFVHCQMEPSRICSLHIECSDCHLLVLRDCMIQKKFFTLMNPPVGVGSIELRKLEFPFDKVRWKGNLGCSGGWKLGGVGGIDVDMLEWSLGDVVKMEQSQVTTEAEEVVGEWRVVVIVRSLCQWHVVAAMMLVLPTSKQ